MRLALVEPYVSVDSLRAYADRCEPSHLVGMYNLLKAAGCDVTLIDAYSNNLSAKGLVGRLVEEDVTHAGFTVYDYSPCVSYMQKVFEYLPDGITTIVGGPGATYCTDRIVELLGPDWLVKGEGEDAIVGLYRAGFSVERLYSMGHGLSAHGKTTTLYSRQLSFEDIPFERPYELEPYDYHASPRVQRGCVGRCVFCSGAYQKEFDYISTSLARRLMDHLVFERSAKVIAPSGPDFTTVPHRANDMVRVILEGGFDFHSFRPGVRLDTLSVALKQAPSLWQRLSERYSVSMESSIESFSPARLRRLGKNVSEDFFNSIFKLLQEIFNRCNCTIVLGRIAMDPTITIDEFITDCQGFRRLFERFGERVTIGGMLMNQFIPLQGTPATEMPAAEKNPWLLSEPQDRLMARLKEELLDNHEFRSWCMLAEGLGEFRERNMVFDEILRVAEEEARALKRRHVVKG